MSEAETLAEKPAFAFGGPAFRANPYPGYKFLRENMPVWHTPDGRFVFSRHEDVTTLLRDPRLGHANDGTEMPPEFANEPALRGLRRSMVLLDPPAHTRIRGLVAKAFSARRVEDLRPRIEQIVDQLIDAVIERGEMDIIADFAHKLPVTVICDMLGIPEEDRAPFLAQAQVLGRIIDPVPISRADLDASNARAAKMGLYWAKLFAYRRENPGDDLTSGLLLARQENDALSDDEITSNIGLLFAAGHETTANLIGNGMLALARNLEQREILAGNFDLISNGVEEMLRYDSPVQLTGRTALHDTKVGDAEIPQGARVMALLGAANHDAAAYEGDPEVLDVVRPSVKPVSFGGGIHFCLGAQLARIEGEIAFRKLFERLPNLRVTDPKNVEWKETVTLRGLKALPATW